GRLSGEGRGSLNGSQRAEVLSFATEWRREATGGILIDVPAGTSNAGAAASAAREVRATLAAAGVPSDAVQLRETRPHSPAKLVTLRLHYPRVMADAVSTRPDRPRPHPRAPQQQPPPVLELRLRQAAQSRRDGRDPRRSGAAAQRSAALQRAPHHRA